MIYAQLLRNPYKRTSFDRLDSQTSVSTVSTTFSTISNATTNSITPSTSTVNFNYSVPSILCTTWNERVIFDQSEPQLYASKADRRQWLDSGNCSLAPEYRLNWRETVSWKLESVFLAPECAFFPQPIIAPVDQLPGVDELTQVGGWKVYDEWKVSGCD